MRDVQRFKYRRALSPEAAEDPAVMGYLLEHPSPWLFRGPRGGWYRAFGPVEHRIVNDMGTDWMRGMVSLVERTSARRIRPGSRAWREHIAPLLLPT